MKKGLISWIVLFISIVVMSARAQETINAYFAGENLSPPIGVPVTLTLTAEVPAGANIQSWPEFPEDAPPFMLLEAGEVYIQQDGERQIHQQTFTVILWEAGDFQTPEMHILYTTATGESTETAVEATFFTVPSMLDGISDVLRPLKPPIYLPYLPPWLILVSIGIVITVGYGLRWLTVRRRISFSDARPGTPVQIALSQLTRMSKQKLSANVLYPQVADCIREYVQQRYNVPAQEMTTAELMDTLLKHPRFTPQLKDDLLRLMEQADLVKFARFQPPPGSSQRLLDFARRWVENAEKLKIDMGGERI